MEKPFDALKSTFTQIWLVHADDTHRQKVSPHPVLHLLHSLSVSNFLVTVYCKKKSSKSTVQESPCLTAPGTCSRAGTWSRRRTCRAGPATTAYKGMSIGLNSWTNAESPISIQIWLYDNNIGRYICFLNPMKQSRQINFRSDLFVDVFLRIQKDLNQIPVPQIELGTVEH